MGMKALDLFCSAGGATRGLQILGFEVTGIDSKHQPNYCGDHFICKNALGVDYRWVVEEQQFDFIFASPPCQRYVPSANRMDSPDLVKPTRLLLQRLGVPWVIENVPSAPLFEFITLCGTMFPTLRVIRHRRFEFQGFKVEQPFHVPKSEHPPVYSFDRRKGRLQGLNEDENYITVAGNNASLGAMSEAMGISWMTRPEIAQAVPPIYATYIARSYLNGIENTATNDGPQ